MYFSWALALILCSHLNFHQVSSQEWWAICREFFSHELRWSCQSGTVDRPWSHNCNNSVWQRDEASEQILRFPVSVSAWFDTHSNRVRVPWHQLRFLFWPKGISLIQLFDVWTLLTQVWAARCFTKVGVARSGCSLESISCEIEYETLTYLGRHGLIFEPRQWCGCREIHICNW